MNYRLLSGIFGLIIIFNIAFGRELQPDNTVFYNLKGMLVSVLKPSELNRGLGNSFGKWSQIQYPAQGVVGYRRGNKLTVHSSYLSGVENNLSWQKLDFGPNDQVAFSNPGLDFLAIDARQAGELLMEMPEEKIPGLIALLQQKQSRWLWQQGSWQNVHLEDGQFILVKPWQKSVTHKRLPFLHSSKPEYFEWIHAGELMWNESNRLVFGDIESLKLDELIFPEIESYHFLLRNPQDRGLIAALAADKSGKKLLYIDRFAKKYELAAELKGDFLNGKWHPGGEKFSWLEQKGDLLRLQTIGLGDLQQNSLTLPGSAADYSSEMSYSPDGLALFLIKNSSQAHAILKISGQKISETAITFRGGGLESIEALSFSATRLEELKEKVWLFVSLQTDGQRSLYELEIAPEKLRYQPLDVPKLPKTTNHNQLVFFEELSPVAKNYYDFVMDMKSAEERFVFYLDFQENFIKLPDIKYNPEGISFFAFNCANNQLRGFSEQKERIDSETIRKMQDAMQHMVDESRRINSSLMKIQKQVMLSPEPYSKDDFEKWVKVMDEYDQNLKNFESDYRNDIKELNESLSRLESLNREFADFLEKKHPPLLEKAQALRSDLSAFRKAQTEIRYAESDEDLVRLLNRELKWFFRQVETSGDLLVLQMVQLGDIEECDYENYYAKLLQQEKELEQSLKIGEKLVANYAETVAIFAGDDNKAKRAALLQHLHTIHPALQIIERNEAKLEALTELLNEYGPEKELWFWHYNALFDAWKKYLGNK